MSCVRLSCEPLYLHFAAAFPGPRLRSDRIGRFDGVADGCLQEEGSKGEKERKGKQAGKESCFLALRVNSLFKLCSLIKYPVKPLQLVCQLNFNEARGCICIS